MESLSPLNSKGSSQKNVTWYNTALLNFDQFPKINAPRSMSLVCGVWFIPKACTQWLDMTIGIICCESQSVHSISSVETLRSDQSLKINNNTEQEEAGVNKMAKPDGASAPTSNPGTPPKPERQRQRFRWGTVSQQRIGQETKFCFTHCKMTQNPKKIYL